MKTGVGVTQHRDGQWFCRDGWVLSSKRTRHDPHTRICTPKYIFLIKALLYITVDPLYITDLECGCFSAPRPRTPRSYKLTVRSIWSRMPLMRPSDIALIVIISTWARVVVMQLLSSYWLKMADKANVFRSRPCVTTIPKWFVVHQDCAKS